VGVILFEMLAGRRPFEGHDVETLLLAHSDDRPPTFAEIGFPDLVPPTIEEVVRACLEKYPEDRPQTAEELALRYEAALGKQIYHKPEVAEAPPPAPEPASPPAVIYHPPPPGVSRESVAAARRPRERLGVLPGSGVRGVIVHELSTVMPESMAMLKLKGFVHDLGGVIIESVPGMIRVRLKEPEAPARKSGGLLGWLTGRAEETVTAEPRVRVEMELLMEKKDPLEPNRLFITMTLRNPSGPATAEWKSRCEQIVRNLRAYL
jgi:serine/threonine-protein kinase